MVDKHGHILGLRQIELQYELRVFSCTLLIKLLLEPRFTSVLFQIIRRNSGSFFSKITITVAISACINYLIISPKNGLERMYNIGHN